MANHTDPANVNNVFGSTTGHGALTSSHAQNEYYARKLLRDKLKDAPGIGEENAKKILKLSGLEEWKIKILLTLADYSDDSPEMLQYYSILKCNTKEQVADKMAEKAYNKQQLNLIMDSLIKPNEVTASIKARQAQAAAARKTAFGLNY